jgi:hypothetical protein
MLNVLHPRNSCELQAAERCHFFDLGMMLLASNFGIENTSHSRIAESSQHHRS